MAPQRKLHLRARGAVCILAWIVGPCPKGHAFADTMEPLSGKREHQPDLDAPALIIGAGAAGGNDNRIPSAVRTAIALILRVGPAPVRPPSAGCYCHRGLLQGPEPFFRTLPGLGWAYSTNQKYLKFSGQRARPVGRASVPAILSSRDTVRAIQWRARRPALPSEDKSESDILRLGLQASSLKARIFLDRFFGKCAWLSAKRGSRGRSV